ncbi:MAG: hypothetical protein R3C54_06045 [Parvularculaceae bacterium]
MALATRAAEEQRFDDCRQERRVSRINAHEPDVAAKNAEAGSEREGNDGRRQNRAAKPEAHVKPDVPGADENGLRQEEEIQQNINAA